MIRYCSLFGCLLVILALSGCYGPERVTFTPLARTAGVITYRETVLVQTDPPGCSVYLNDKFVGTSPVEVPIGVTDLPITQRGSQRQMQRTDFAGGTETYRYDPVWGPLESGGGARFTFTATAEGYDPATRTLNVGTQDDDVFRTVLARTSIPLPSELVGERHLLLTMRESRRATAQQQQQQQQTVIMPARDREDAPSVGKVIVSSPIEGADIYVDGLFVGNAPANLTLTSGVHIIEVKRGGYRPFRRELRVLAGSEITLRAELERDE